VDVCLCSVLCVVS